MAIEAWTEANRRILDALDLRDEYAALGLRMAGSTPNPSGWISCHVYGADDRNPSAGVCVAGEHPMKGKYKEFTGEARCMGLFDFAVLAGRFADWQEARKHYAKQAGVKLPGGSRPKDVSDKLVFRDWNQALVEWWCGKKPPIAHWAVRIAGGRLAGWPVSKNPRHLCVALPIYGPQGIYEDPQGWVIWNQTGQPLELPQKGEKPRHEKMLTVGGSRSGMMNRYAHSMLDKAEICWKVEGPGDMLALQSKIPQELLEKHLVFANSGGSKEVPRPEYIAMFAGKTVYVAHDCDKDGVSGVSAGRERSRRLRRKSATSCCLTSSMTRVAKTCETTSTKATPTPIC